MSFLFISFSLSARRMRFFLTFGGEFVLNVYCCCCLTLYIINSINFIWLPCRQIYECLCVFGHVASPHECFILLLKQHFSPLAFIRIHISHAHVLFAGTLNSAFISYMNELNGYYGEWVFFFLAEAHHKILCAVAYLPYFIVFVYYER